MTYILWQKRRKEQCLFNVFIYFFQLRINWYLYINHSTVHIHLRKINIIQIIKPRLLNVNLLQIAGLSLHDVQC